tara:strand:- start:401 stop:511 length:111 start_codon:yes stop_codon:yes gene_type:complete
MEQVITEFQVEQVDQVVEEELKIFQVVQVLVVDQVE